MDFQLSESQKELVARTRAFAEAEIAPYAARWDVEEHIPRSQIQKYADVGWFGMTLPAEYGGGGYAALDAIKVTLPPCYFATLSLSQSSHFLTIVSTDVKLV